MTKLEKIELHEQKTREKIAEMQAILKQIDGARTEQENLQIIQQVRALKLTREELYAFINGGAMPAPLAGAVDDTAEPETIYSRRGRKNNDMPEEKTEINNFESEVTNNEE